MKNKYLISVVEASERYGFPRDTLYRMVRSNHPDLPFIRINGHVKINVPLFEKWLDSLSKEHKEIQKHNISTQ